MENNFFGKIMVTLIMALIRTFIGICVGIAIIGLILVMLLFFGVLIPNGETTFFEFVSLLSIGAVVGGIIGLFDMLNFSIPKTTTPQDLTAENNWRNRNFSNSSGEQ